jgi:putative spermidine/putrescine transport system permease protein
MGDTTQEVVLAADGRPLKQSLRRALMRQKMRALMLVAPLLIFVVVTFIVPILSMLFRSVENDIVPNTIPGTVTVLSEWDGSSGEPPHENVYRNLYIDLFKAEEAKQHTRLGTRLNYEQTGLSSLFRTTGRSLDDIGELWQDPLEDIDPNFEEGAFWYQLMSGSGGEDFLEQRRELITMRCCPGRRAPIPTLRFGLRSAMAIPLPRKILGSPSMAHSEWI